MRKDGEWRGRTEGGGEEGGEKERWKRELKAEPSPRGQERIIYIYIYIYIYILFSTNCVSQLSCISKLKLYIQISTCMEFSELFGKEQLRYEMNSAKGTELIRLTVRNGCSTN